LVQQSRVSGHFALFWLNKATQSVRLARHRALFDELGYLFASLPYIFLQFNSQII
jgi:hypothetical protein